MNKPIRIFSLLAISLTGIICACEDDLKVQENFAGFETAELGLEGDEAVVKIVLSRPEAVDVPVTIKLAAHQLTYGTEFTTIPDGSSGSFSVIIPAQSTEATFTLVKTPAIFLSGQESVAFGIESVGEPAVIGEIDSVKLLFSAFVSNGSQLQLNGLIAAEPGSSAGNSVFVDLSNNQQTPVARSSWDLGFYNGSDFRVIINNTRGASVVAVNKTDLTQVSGADVNPDDLKVGQGWGNFEIVDDVFGDITNTAIPAISTTEADNKVYVINRVGGSGNVSATADFVKIRVLRTATGYALQHAKINETTINTVTIDKDENSTFNYVSFDNGAVNVEPAKTKWDIQWTWSMYYTQNPPGSTTNIPYSFSDIVFINHLNGTQAAEVLTSSVTYDDFTESNLSSVVFKNERNVIGSGWRAASPTPGASGAKTDRFYVIKDPVGNIYKLKFVSFHADDGGQRGKPVIKYALVKAE